MLYLYLVSSDCADACMNGHTNNLHSTRSEGRVEQMVEYRTRKYFSVWLFTWQPFDTGAGIKRMSHIHILWYGLWLKANDTMHWMAYVKGHGLVTISRSRTSQKNTFFAFRHTQLAALIIYAPFQRLFLNANNLFSQFFFLFFHSLISLSLCFIQILWLFISVSVWNVERQYAMCALSKLWAKRCHPPDLEFFWISMPGISVLFLFFSLALFLHFAHFQLSNENVLWVKK